MGNNRSFGLKIHEKNKKRRLVVSHECAELCSVTVTIGTVFTKEQITAEVNKAVSMKGWLPDYIVVSPTADFVGLDKIKANKKSIPVRSNEPKHKPEKRRRVFGDLGFTHPERRFA